MNGIKNFIEYNKYLDFIGKNLDNTELIKGVKAVDLELTNNDEDDESNEDYEDEYLEGRDY